MGSTIDEKRVEAFGERLMGMLNEGSLALMISVGHRTGLFDAMADLPVSTSSEIANAAGLEERYVREWLGAMVVGGIVEYERARGYNLPVEHAQLLTRSAAPNNMAAFMQYVAVFGGVEGEIVERFHSGGGIPCECYARFHEVMAEDSGQTVVAALLDSIVPLVPGLERALERGIDVLDIGCGSGRAIVTLAEAFPASRFTGYDISDEVIKRAQDHATEAGAQNACFTTVDAAAITDVAAFDLIMTFDAVHDQADPPRVLRNIRSLLRPSGVYIMQDIHASSDLQKNIGRPLAPFLYSASTMHCLSVSLAAGGPGLGAMWGKELALEMLSEAGFRKVTVHELEHDAQNYYYVALP
jgi:2-polyprenyl-3-methyl-5-hydroxy-6-metoxy-1,4-benzoquinol methylase